MLKAVCGESYFDYWVYFPKDYDAKTKYPLVFFLHGAGERGNDLKLVLRYGIPKLLNDGLEYGAVVVSPQCKADITWTSQSEKLREFLAFVIDKYNVDEDAVSITGLSMGGFGTWQMICDYPELFSAAAPICGGGMSWRADRITHLPIRIFHGEKDTDVDSFYSKDFYRRLKQYNASDVELFLYPNIGHGSWVQAYEQTDLLDWLISKRRS